jgi:RNA polymerase sigma-70 factor (ECF subfamily)
MDVAEFEGLLSRYGRDIYSFCRYLNPSVADDLYQDTVLAVFEMRGKIDCGLNPKSLFLSVAVGKWKNMRRKAGRRNALAPQAENTENNAGGFTEAVADSSPGANPQIQAENAFEREAIQTALGGLDDKFRIPLILHYFEESDLGTIAQICGIPKGTVKSRLHKGRALLKTALERVGFT